MYNERLCCYQGCGKSFVRKAVVTTSRSRRWSPLLALHSTLPPPVCLSVIIAYNHTLLAESVRWLNWFLANPMAIVFRNTTRNTHNTHIHTHTNMNASVVVFSKPSQAASSANCQLILRGQGLFYFVSGNVLSYHHTTCTPQRLHIRTILLLNVVTLFYLYHKVVQDCEINQNYTVWLHGSYQQIITMLSGQDFELIDVLFSDSCAMLV